MAWYRSGTISLTNGSAAVTGAGTAWILNASVGEALLAPDGKLYEISAIASDTSITLATAYLGATQAGQAYVLVPTQSYIRDLAAQAAALVNAYSSIANNAGAGKFGDGTVAAPGVTFAGDQDTGFFRSANNEVTFVANGVAQFKYSATGGVQFLSTSVDINGGTIDGTVVGGAVPAAGNFTTLSASGLAVADVVTAKGATSIDANTAFESNAPAFGLTAYHAQNNGGYGAFFGYDNIRYSGGAAMVRNIANTPLVFETNNTECGRFDRNGNLGLSVVPSAWVAGRNIEAGRIGNFVYGATGASTLAIGANAYQNDGWRYANSASAAGMYDITGNVHSWYSAPSGTAGDPISFTQAMTLFENGALVVGEGNNSYHKINKPSSVADGTPILEISRFGTAGFAVFAVPGSYGSTAEAAAWIGASATTSRSINAAGTVNASGADYAEYERNNGLVIGKGSVIGFKADGTLTLTYAEAIRFGIKSTNPSYVGGDVWGTEDQVGKRPDQPSYSAPTYTGPQAPVEPVKPATQEGEEVNAEADDAAYLEALNAYQDQLTAYFDAQAAHKAAVETAEAAHAEAVAQYEIDKAAFDERLEAARQTVDRIAYSGKVPVNVLGATPGGYIVAAEGETGEIVGEFVADPDFAQYKKAVGRVNRILEDGRCEVAVIVH